MPPLNPFMPTVAFNICCVRDCVSRHNGGTAGAPLKPLRDDSALRATVGINGLRGGGTHLGLHDAAILSRTADASFSSLVTEESCLNLVKSNRNQFVFIIYD